MVILARAGVMLSAIARLRRLRIFHLPSDGWEANHYVVTGVMAWLCFILLYKPSIFETSPAFAAFLGFADEYQWSVLFGSFAMIGWWGIETNHVAIRRASCCTLCFAHLLFCIFLFLGAGLNTGTGPYAGYAALALGRLVMEGRRNARL